MNTWLKTLRVTACILALALPFVGAKAEDIDIFVRGGTADSSLPNVIFVLDNTSNWARQSQQWPGGQTQGQSEVRAIRSALAGQTDKLNVGLLEFTTGGNANQDGAFVRFALQKLTTSSQATLNSKLDAIYSGINATDEKRNSNTSYGNLIYDVYNYLGGFQQSFAGQGTVASKADINGYTSAYSTFRSPLTSDSLCAKTFLIFISNPNNSGPATDSAANSTALKALYAAVSATPGKLASDSSGTALPIPLFTTVTGTPVSLGKSAQCYATTDVASCTAAESTGTGLCVDQASCACTSTPAATDSCSTSGGSTGGNGKGNGNGNGGGNSSPTTYHLPVQRAGSTTVTPTGSVNTTSGSAWNLDDWTKFLFNYGVPVAALNESGQPVTQRVSVVTYAIDVFNAQQNADHTGLMLSASKGVGGGNYFAARSEGELTNALNSALSDILSVSSTFAAVSLPLSATNRAQQENQVFIGMFRPDQQTKPRWFGNLKRYQIGLFGGVPELADATGKQAVSPLTGFALECAQSYWSTDSGNFWEALGISPAPRSQCDPNPYNVWSDLPDGPFVEKGGAAQVTRQSVIANRSILTVSGSNSLGAMTANTFRDSDVDSTVTKDTLFNYLKGSIAGTGETKPATSNGRPSIHGDVIHSRPLPINYGGTTGTVIYYGGNDGLFRAVSAATGAEKWTFLAPEHYGRIKRLYANSPLVSFPNQSTGTNPVAAKDYFFDGSAGQIIHYNSNNQVDLAYIYPTMRRGGRMVYAFNVTDPSDPKLLWRRGCPDLTSDTGCDTDLTGMGQTWSTPHGAKLGGYTTNSVVIFGAGYDRCLDPDQSSFDCSSGKGKGVYVLDAVTGAKLAFLATDAPVVADVSLVDLNFDGNTDFAYVADAAGNLYRLNFVDPSTLAPLANTDWKLPKIAFTQSAGRRFLNAPTVAAYKNSVYVSLGSGNRERPLITNYPYTADVDDRFYVFLDTPSGPSANDSSQAVNLDGSLMNNATPAPACTDPGVFPGVGDKRGWYMSLSGRGEQVVNPAVVAGGDVLFNSYQPGGAKVGMCTRPGVATGYQMSLFNGSSCNQDRSVVITGGGMPIAPTLSTVVVKDPDDKVVTICIGCKGLNPTPIEPTTDETRKRVYWNTDVDR